MRRLFFVLSLLAGLGNALTLLAQNSYRLNTVGPAWPTDAASLRLRTVLDTFLLTRADPVARTRYVWAPAALETVALLDELADLEPPTGQPPSPYRLYLTNLVRLDSAHYLLQLAALGELESAPRLRASFELRSWRQGNRFWFYSPLQPNTAGWQQRRLETTRFHFSGALPKGAAAYARQTAFFDRKLGNAGQQTDFYLANHLWAALQALGLTSKADYLGYVYNAVSARLPGRLLVVSGDPGPDQFDPHDLWHRCLRNVVPSGNINKAADEGCAFLYGGSWGISWPIILRQFHEYAQARPAEDWLATYPTAASVSRAGQKPLLVRYVLNALIMQHLEQTKGFNAVRELLTCGPYEPTNARYFQTLERVAGITRANFNERVGQLIRASR